MNLLNTYKKFKDDYPKFLIFIESGNFIEILEDDAYIMHYLLKYKVLVKKKFIHVGFPKKMLDSVVKTIENINILLVKNASGGASSKIINIPLVNEYGDLIDVSKRYYKYEQEIIEIENMLIKLSNSKRFPKIIKKVKEILYE